MKGKLLYPQGDAPLHPEPDAEREQRAADLELGQIVEAMSGGDPEIARMCRQVLDMPLQNVREIRYRQEILQDCLNAPDTVRSLYRICREAEEKRKNTWYRLTSPHVTTVYAGAKELLKIYMEALTQIRRILQEGTFASEGLKGLTELLCRELSREYLEQLKPLQFELGDDSSILIRAGFGPYLQGVGYTMRQRGRGLSRLQWVLQPAYTVADRDMNGAADLDARRDRAISSVAEAMARAAQNLEHFTGQLRMELAFYVGALNLLQKLHTPVCFPEPGEGRSWEELYDCSLALRTGGTVTGNTVQGNSTGLFLITGANQGGKTTFLRSVGQCQLMAQCGLFVCAKSCRFPIKKDIYTHFKREEDRKLDSGKLDEELRRMSGIVRRIRPGCMLLSNESFSSTNDPEGSEILGQITRALLERGIEVFAVTHLINFALDFSQRSDVLCLRAQRRENGERTFRMVPGKPLKTAFGQDVFNRIFPPEERT